MSHFSLLSRDNWCKLETTELPATCSGSQDRSPGNSATSLRRLRDKPGWGLSLPFSILPNQRSRQADAERSQPTFHSPPSTQMTWGSKTFKISGLNCWGGEKVGLNFPPLPQSLSRLVFPGAEMTVQPLLSHAIRSTYFINVHLCHVVFLLLKGRWVVKMALGVIRWGSKVGVALSERRRRYVEASNVQTLRVIKGCPRAVELVKVKKCNLIGIK